MRGGSIYLVGARGSGKSTVGRHLAAESGRSFVDLDIYLCKRENKSIDQIVRDQGWDAFRTLEKQCLKDASAEGNVIATGGGVVLDAENREFMRANGIVFWLHASPAVLHARLSINPAHRQRPPLTQKGLLAEIVDVLNTRKKLYEDACHWIIDGEQNVEQICTLMRDCLE